MRPSAGIEKKYQLLFIRLKRTIYSSEDFEIVTNLDVRSLSGLISERRMKGIYGSAQAYCSLIQKRGSHLYHPSALLRCAPTAPGEA